MTIKDPSWLLERMSNQKVEGNDGPGFRYVRCPKMLWEELVRFLEGLKVEEGRCEREIEAIIGSVYGANPAYLAEKSGRAAPQEGAGSQRRAILASVG